MSSIYTVRADVHGVHIELACDHAYAAGIVAMALARQWHVPVQIWRAGEQVQTCNVD